MPAFIQYPSGLEYLGSTALTATGTTSATVTIPERDFLLIVVRITGYAGQSEIAALRFNGDAGTNYQSRFLTCAAAGTALTNVADGSGGTGSTLIRLAGTAASVRRSIIATVTNDKTTAKIVQLSSHSYYGTAAGTEGQVDLTGGGVWDNTTSQITSVVLVTAGGLNLSARSGFAVFGRNL